jgi:HlyD family secretion protein
VLTRKAEPGDVATAGKVLLELADAGETRLRHRGREKPAPPQARPEGPRRGRRLAGQPFDAELYYLAPAVDPSAAPSRSASGCPRPPAFLRPDMTISVETVTGQKDSTLVLPTEAVREPDSGKLLGAGGGTVASAARCASASPASARSRSSRASPRATR